MDMNFAIGTPFYDDAGRFQCLVILNGIHAINLSPSARGWTEFMDWFSKQTPAPYSLVSGVPTVRPDVDSELVEIKAILTKRDSDVTPAELKTATLKALRRLAARGL